MLFFGMFVHLVRQCAREQFPHHFQAWDWPKIIHCCPLLFAFITSTVYPLVICKLCCKHSVSYCTILSFIEVRIVSQYPYRPSGPANFQFGTLADCLSINSTVKSIKPLCRSDGHSALPLSVFCTSSPDTIPEFSAFSNIRSDGIISLRSLKICPSVSAPPALLYGLFQCYCISYSVLGICCSLKNFLSVPYISSQLFNFSLDPFVSPRLLCLDCCSPNAHLFPYSCSSRINLLVAVIVSVLMKAITSSTSETAFFTVDRSIKDIGFIGFRGSIYLSLWSILL